MLVRNRLVESILRTDRLKLRNLCPFFSGFGLFTQGFQRFGEFRVVDDPMGGELDRFFKMGNRCLSRGCRHLSVDQFSDSFENWIERRQLKIPTSQNQMAVIVRRVKFQPFGYLLIDLFRILYA